MTSQVSTVGKVFAFPPRHLYKSLAIDVDIRLGRRGDTINLNILYNLGSTENAYPHTLGIDEEYHHQVSPTQS